jgi:hypothetical protein
MLFLIRQYVYELPPLAGIPAADTTLVKIIHRTKSRVYSSYYFRYEDSYTLESRPLIVRVPKATTKAELCRLVAAYAK